MNQLTIRTCLSSVGILALTLIQPSCTGTEADNPFTDPATTSLCKGDESYVPLSHPREPLTLDKHLFEAPVPAGPVPPRESQLSSLIEIPVWLECVEWDLRDGIFDYQIANFRGGCAVDWTGGGEVTSEGDVRVELQNKSCDVAGCGSCLYDLRSNGYLALPKTNETVTFELIRTDCEGEVTVETSWSLPVSEKPHGLLCREADLWGANKSANNAAAGIGVELYAPCGDGSDMEPLERTCAENLSCVAGRCVPACSSNDECPLAGALTCQEGHCQLAE